MKYRMSANQILREYVPLMKKLRRELATESAGDTPECLRRRTLTLHYLTVLFEQLAQISALTALDALSVGSLEFLISAFGADRSGRPLTYDEKAARQMYRQVLGSKSAGLGIKAENWIAPQPDIGLIDRAITNCLRHRLPDHTITLAFQLFGGAEATGVRRDAARTFWDELNRLLSLAGFDEERWSAVLKEWKESEKRRSRAA
jgi:hypothetical protein